MLRITEVTDSATLAEIRGDWDALVDRAPQATIYQTWAWNEAWWQVFGRDKKLLLLLVHQGSDLVGIGPFYVSRHLGTPLRRLAFLGTGPSDFLTVIAADGYEEDVYRAVAQALVEHDRYDLADLQQIPATDPFAHWLMHATASKGSTPTVFNGRLVRVRPIEVCPQVELPETWDAYLRSLGKKMRTNISYYTRRALRELPEAFMGLCGEADLEEGMQALFSLHQRRWRARMMPGCFSSARMRRFHLEVARRFHQRGWLRLHVLKSAGRVLSALYCFSYRGRYYYYLGGFDPNLSRYSLGTILTAAALQHAYEEGCRTFDFLRGKEAYKERWKPVEQVNYQCLVARNHNWRAEAMLALNRIERYIEHRAKAFSDRGKGAR